MAAAFRPGRFSWATAADVAGDRGTARDSGGASALPTQEEPMTTASNQTTPVPLKRERRLGLKSPRLGESGPMERAG